MSQYPTILAGDRITASLLMSMESQTVVKLADETRTSTAVASADTELFFAVEANATYVWDGMIKYLAATGAADILLSFTAPAGATGEWTGVGVGTTVVSESGGVINTDTQGTLGYMVRMESNDLTASRTYGGLGTAAANALFVPINGSMRTSSTAGTLTLAWAQGSSNATPSTISADSWLRVQRVA